MIPLHTLFELSENSLKTAKRIGVAGLAGAGVYGIHKGYKKYTAPKHWDMSKKPENLSQRTLRWKQKAYDEERAKDSERSLISKVASGTFNIGKKIVGGIASKTKDAVIGGAMMARDGLSTSGQYAGKKIGVAGKYYNDKGTSLLKGIAQKDKVWPGKEPAIKTGVKERTNSFRKMNRRMNPDSHTIKTNVPTKLFTQEYTH